MCCALLLSGIRISGVEDRQSPRDIAEGRGKRPETLIIRLRKYRDCKEAYIQVQKSGIEQEDRDYNKDKGVRGQTRDIINDYGNGDRQRVDRETRKTKIYNKCSGSKRTIRINVHDPRVIRRNDVTTRGFLA